ncbi:hypothetical protein [Clostridium beijerinckii]|uniref:hypothetical protein n=1 Tax=Clostridium beijerinckii TaxID=1520 RepID=UPI00098BED12|nr:hypothetical protein [Clostridium beijerinckii]NRT78222.1 hypothetical protein [Clostridium beijerinckii]OOM47922.1 hypothetical protein CBEIJ_26620 [Clostridium beijerinckii]
MNNKYQSTRMSKFIYGSKKYSKYWNSFNGSMFLRDFNTNMAIEFAYKPSRGEFFTIESSYDTLKEMITVNDYSYLEYELSSIISRVIYNMILRGKAFLEVVYYMDDEGCTKGFDFQTFNYKKYIKFRKNTRFYYKNRINEECIKGHFDIPNNNLIIFKLSDLGLHKKEFYSIEKRLRNIDITKIPLSKINELNINVSEYEKEEELEILSATKNIPWNTRSNNIITEPYSIYRLAKFKKIKLNLLEYIIKQINDKISEIGIKYNFEGKITYKTLSIKEVEEIVRKMGEGDILIKDVIDYLFCNKIYK